MDKKNLAKGRGSALLNLLKQKEEQKMNVGLMHSFETPTQSSAEQTESSEVYSSQSSVEALLSGIGRGRGQKNTTTQSTSVSKPVSKDPPMTIGRGLKISNLLQKHIENQPGPSTIQASEFTEVDDSGVLGTLADLSVYDKDSSKFEITSEESKVICRQGKSGERVNLYANYINLKFSPNKGLFQYEVKFAPDIDSRPLRRALLNQHADELGCTKIFDGVLLYLPIKLPNNITVCHSEHPKDGSQITLTIILKKRQSMNENIQFFNILFGRVMRALSLIRVGRQSFNPKGAHIINQHQLEVWPGYVIAVNEYEGGLKLCLDVKHRVLRTQTIRDLMTDIYQKKEGNFRDAVMKEVIGTSVLTRYNNRTYRIDDIAWDKTPKFSFPKNGQEVTLLNYYKQHWGIDIHDEDQPLLVHRTTERTSSGEKQEKILLLVPELSYAAGLSDGIRSNFKIMKDLNAFMKVSPNKRRDAVQFFVKQIRENELARQILSEWNLHLDEEIVRFTGRCLPPEEIFFGQNKKYKLADKCSDWSNMAVRSPMLRTPNLKDWCIFYIKRDENCINEFLKMLNNVVRAINMEINSPRKIVLKDDRTETYLQEIQKYMNNSLELVVIVFPTNRTDRYSAVKRLCCVQKPVVSQVIMSRTISNGAKLKSVTEKIVLQINCKLGGALWTVHLPLRNTMICGIDVYHTGIGRTGRSVAGFVASLDVQMTKWHSKVCMQASGQELMDMLQLCFISAINAYRQNNKCIPDRIIVYRDGVGDGDIDYVLRYEVKQLLETFKRIEPNYKPQLSMIIVQKHINTRLFIDGRNNLENAAAGTVVDSCITRKNYYDFFLVPQNIREGTIMPIHYIVAYDASEMETDHMQRLTYKLCHMYYNWCGTIRVPAPCQYAHKLAYQIGQNIQAEPHHSFQNILYYL